MPANMRLIAIVILVAIGTALSGRPASAGECEEENIVTVTGKIEGVFETDNGRWWVDLEDRPNNECEVWSINSRTARPASCTAGATITAKGILALDDGDDWEIVEATSITCTP